MSVREAISAGPVKRRFVVLDMLRGFALLGIILANFPEFSLWTFQTEGHLASMPSSDTDHLTHWLLYLFVDGKFYTLFSLLFGIGFSIIINNCKKRGANGKHIFYRRMTILAIIGCLHLLMLWSGDILLLYALMGMLLPLFWSFTDKGILRWGLFFLLLPIVIDLIRVISGFTLASLPYDAWWSKCAEYGITEDNFGSWLHDADSYRGVHQFLMQGAWERLWEFVSGNRYFKVLGLFLFGMYVGRKKIYASLDTYRPTLKRFFLLGTIVGLPLSVLYAWSGMKGHPWGEVCHSVLYTFSVYPLGFCYASGLALLYHRFSRLSIWKALSFPGKMALTNYLSQSVIGIILFYGIGFGMGGHTSLICTTIIAMSVYVFQIFFSWLWMRYFQFGPTEWIWRMLTYGKRFRLTKS